MKTNIVFGNFTTNAISGNILFLKLWAKMLSANQIAKFFKIYLKIEVNNEVYLTWR